MRWVARSNMGIRGNTAERVRLRRSTINKMCQWGPFTFFCSPFATGAKKKKKPIKLVRLPPVLISSFSSTLKFGFSEKFACLEELFCQRNSLARRGICVFRLLCSPTKARKFPQAKAITAKRVSIGRNRNLRKIYKQSFGDKKEG